MKHDKKQYPRILMSMLFVAASAAMVHGCTLEDLLAGFAVDSEGNYITCSNLQQIMILSNQDVITYVRAEFEGEFADVFGVDVCPVAAPNCMHEGGDENKPGICNNCPENHAVCKNKCVDITNPNLHIHKCGLEKLECDGDYYDFNNDSSDGCEFQLSINHVKENDAGTLVCVEDYFDLNDDLNQEVASNGCEFQLSPVHIDKDKTQPKNPTEPWICVNGYADLDNDRYSGCEVNGWTDNAHCGAGVIDDQNPTREGKTCLGGYVCKSGKCEESCGQDYIVVCDKLCSNTKIDNAHCGGCNRTCSITANDTRAAVACQDGGCHAIACQPGYYLADADEEVEGKVLKTCKRCADGEYTTRATDTACIACPTTTGAKSMVFDANNNICKAATCNAGYKLNNGQCEPCPTGSISTSDNSCKCLAGTYANATNNTCTNCPAGSYCPTAGLISPIDCPKGQYCTGGSSEPAACPMGTYRSTKNGKSESDCINCPKGTHNNGIGAWACAPIPAGYVGINCRDERNITGCVHYSMCFEGNSVTKCSNMYGGG